MRVFQTAEQTHSRSHNGGQEEYNNGEKEGECIGMSKGQRSRVYCLNAIDTVSFVCVCPCMIICCSTSIAAH